MDSTELTRIFEVAIERGLEEYDAQRLAAELSSHGVVDGDVDTDTAIGLLDGIAKNKRALAENVADEVEPALRDGPSASASGGAPVAADGGGILSETTKETLMVSAMIVNGFTLGSWVAGGEGMTDGLAMMALVALCILMTAWTAKQYDIAIEPA